MQRTMSSEELSSYIAKIKNPSDTFQRFLHDYVTGSPWIRSRGDEDVSVWNKLQGDELDVAKQIILDELQIIPDDSYMRAVSIFKDNRAIPILMTLINTLSHIDLKLLAAKSLYDLTGYKDYVPMLENACKSQDMKLRSYLKYSIEVLFLPGLEESDKERIRKALSE